MVFEKEKQEKNIRKAKEAKRTWMWHIYRLICRGDLVVSLISELKFNLNTKCFFHDVDRQAEIDTNQLRFI